MCANFQQNQDQVFEKYFKIPVFEEKNQNFSGGGLQPF